MGEEWTDKFHKQLKEKELARQETDRDFKVYKDEALKLFDFIEKKVKPITSIHISRQLVARSDKFRADVQGTFETINSLCLKYNQRYLDFVPEGINLDCSKGRIRIRHDSKKLGRFLYLHLIRNRSQDKASPTLVWVINECGEAKEIEDYPIFDETQLERIIEMTFLD